MKRYRFYFSRDIEASFISHLDMMRLFERLFRRIGVKLKFTEGFNPHPKINFLLPMAVGLCSNEEMVEVDFDDVIDFENLKRSMNSLLPVGLKILKIEEATDKIQVNNMYYKCILEADNTICDSLNKFMNEGAKIKRVKKGKTIYKMASDYILYCGCRMIDEKLYQIDFHISVKDGSFIKPEDVINTLSEKYNLTCRILKVIREKINYQRVI